MAKSISVNLQSLVHAGSNVNVTGSGGDSNIEILKRKLASLQKDLLEAMGEQSKAGMEKVKLIQMEIQVTQAQLEQLIQQDAKDSAKTHHDKQHIVKASSTSERPIISHPDLGNNVDEII